MTKTKKHIYWIIYAVLYCSVIQRYIWPNQFCQLIPDVIILFLCIFEKGLANSRAKKIMLYLFLEDGFQECSYYFGL